jgi:RNA polymerase Rpc34 subunit
VNTVTTIFIIIIIILFDSIGGPWYTEQEFDHEFVEELCNFIVQFVNSKGMIDLAGKCGK